MPDLLGPCPCEGCHLECADGICVDPKGVDGPYYQWDCTDYAAYAARKALLEALKAGGWHVDPSNMDYDDWSKIGEAIWESVKAKRGHLIFIPEAQE